MKKSFLEFFDNDIYLMDNTCDKLIINNNYNGIILCDYNLEIISKVYLYDEINISSIITNNNNVLLFCADQNIIISINLIDLRYTKIKVNNEKIFYYKYSFYENNNVVLVSGYNDFFSIDLLDNKIYDVNEEYFDENFEELYDYYKKLRQFNVLKYNQIQKEAIIRKDDSNLCLINYKNTVVELCLFEEEEFHDFEIYYDVIIKISERIVEISKGRITKKIIGDCNYIFLKGIVMHSEEKNEDLLFLVYSNKSNEKNNLVIKISLDFLLNDKEPFVKMSSLLK